MMKRISVLALSMSVLLAAAASADLVNSKHDLSALGADPCAYCHSVHNQVGGLGRPAYLGPLPDVTKVYNSVTYDHDPLTTVDTVNNSDAPLCLSCHDGATVASDSDEIKAIKTNYIVNTDKDIGDSTMDLSNDHPVGFVYTPGLDTEDNELRAPDADSPVHVTFGPNKNEMWCSSCHNVHSNTYTPFLATSNQGSALCLECHIK